MFLFAKLLATANGGKHQQNGGEKKSAANLLPTDIFPFLPTSRSSASPAKSKTLLHFTIPSLILAPATPSEKEVDGYRVAVLVLSGPENFGKRQKLRKLKVPGFRLTFLFLVGLKNSNLDQLLKQEAIQQNDILHLEMEESYANLPRKTLAGLDFALHRMSEYDLILKLDDDLEISGEKLSRALLGEQPWATSTLYCFPLTRVPPYRFALNVKVESESYHI